MYHSGYFALTILCPLVKRSGPELPFFCSASIHSVKVSASLPKGNFLALAAFLAASSYMNFSYAALVKPSGTYVPELAPEPIAEGLATALAAGRSAGFAAVLMAALTGACNA